MGFIFKTIVAFCIGWGALYAAQHYWFGAMLAQIADSDHSGLNLAAPAPAFPTMEIDPQKLRLAINPQVNIDTQKYGRLMIESKQREIDQRIRSELAKEPQPITVPGLRH
jgi:hypothetical protein